MIKTSASRGLRPWFVVHRRELVKQSADSFNNAEVDYGILAVHICNIGSIRSRMSLYQPPDFIVFDECHHQSAGTWSKLFDQFPNAFKIGLTATPQRLDGSGLDKFYEQMINGPSVRWLIDNGFLSDYKLFVPGNPDLSKVHTRMGDYVKSELISMFDKPTITGSAINEYNKRAAGKRAVVFAISIEHSKHIVDQFNCSGINAAHIDGETPANVRDQTIQMFRSGEIKVLSNVDIVGEGFDLPAIECAILLRPTKSLGLYLQQVGRSLRPSPDKLHAVILDHVGNCIQHGLPDAERIWTLRGREKKAKNQSSEPPIKVCKFCFAAQPPASTICKICGHAFETTPRQVDQVEGDLVEYDPSKMKSKRLDEQRRAQTLNELISIGKSRGMKHPYGWAKHVWNARQLKKLRGG
jgi:superfamily II DNA or RNA helicase